MKGIALRLASIAVVFATLLTGASIPAPAANNTGAIIGGLIAGAAIGAAVSGGIKHPQPIYVQPAPPPPPQWGQSFSPRANVWCYPAQQACYNGSGAYNPSWTWKIYAR